ncbi:OsmC family protein [Bacillus sp. EB106-08-02-XG196]|uniref:OsmC family protein n=1 Tax=Bacillus sp. EB106-08-02-XG196 TaxID=2737049 RepID=UPI0015C46E3B|nr:OsmC family protein [Bacillus sp. EB106-08-02-XG196]NWQ43424.1 OsmC family protein [Bacillus sp. EB106-08-02-XG196]
MSQKAAIQQNGINVPALQIFKEDIAKNPANGMIDYKVNLKWLGGTKSKVSSTGITLGNQKIERNFSFIIDEPEQLLGENTNPTPQEYLLGGMGGCILVGYSVGASVLGITLEKLEVDLEAGLDLRGFLEANPDSPIGFKDVKYTIRVKGNGTKEQFEYIHNKVIQTSPNRATVANEIDVLCDLVVEE